MDWGEVGKSVAKLGVPLLGQVLGGPLAGGITSLVSSMLGVDDEPKAVSEAIWRNPDEAKATLQELEARNRGQLQTLIMQGSIQEAQQNAQAYQTELASTDPYITRWRPRLGRRVTDIILAVAAAHIVVMFVGAGMLIFMEGGTELVAAMTALIKELGAEIITLLSGAFALLGYSIRRRSLDKAAERGDPPKPGLLESVIGAIKK